MIHLPRRVGSRDSVRRVRRWVRGIEDSYGVHLFRRSLDICIQCQVGCFHILYRFYSKDICMFPC